MSDAGQEQTEGPSDMSHQAELMLRLMAGASRLPDVLRSRHASFLAGRQNSDGGFSGRRGGSDLYYTGFALRGLTLLERLDEECAVRAATFLGSRLGKAMPPADFVSLVTSAQLVEMVGAPNIFSAAGLDPCETVRTFFSPFRRGDGGYAKTERGPASTYQTFLTLVCQEMVGESLDCPPAIVELIRRRQRPDGGFVEIEAATASGTNPTAAALAVLRQLAGLTEAISAGAVQFLGTMQAFDGGLRANARVPVADLLSTFTGLAALADLNRTEAIDLAAIASLAAGLEMPEGGFRGGIWDTVADVEYTFYGLGTLALLTDRAT